MDSSYQERDERAIEELRGLLSQPEAMEVGTVTRLDALVDQSLKEENTVSWGEMVPLICLVFSILAWVAPIGLSWASLVVGIGFSATYAAGFRWVVPGLDEGPGR